MNSLARTPKMVKRVLLFYRKYGIIMLINAILSIVFKKWVVLYTPLTKSFFHIDCKIPIVIREVCKKDLNELRNLGETYEYRNLSHFSEWLRRGDAFFIAIYNERIVGYTSAGHRDSILEELVILRKDDAAGLGVFVLPEYRGKRIGPSLLAARTRQLKDRGYRRIVTHINLRNYPSRKAHMHAGSVEHTFISPFQVFKNEILHSIRDTLH